MRPYVEMAIKQMAATKQLLAFKHWHFTISPSCKFYAKWQAPSSFLFFSQPIALIQAVPGTKHILGSTVVSPYVGMARKQNGGYNASISVQTLIFHLVVNSTRLKTVRSALWHCSNSTVALRLLENVVKVTNLEVVKIEFRHLPFHLLLLQTA